MNALVGILASRVFNLYRRGALQDIQRWAIRSPPDQSHVSELTEPSLHRPYSPSGIEPRCIGKDRFEVVQGRLIHSVVLVEDHCPREHHGDAEVASGESEICIFRPVAAVFKGKTSDAVEMTGRDREPQRPEMLMYVAWHVCRKSGSCMVRDRKFSQSQVIRRCPGKYRLPKISWFCHRQGRILLRAAQKANKCLCRGDAIHIQKDQAFRGGVSRSRITCTSQGQSAFLRKAPDMDEFHWHIARDRFWRRVIHIDHDDFLGNEAIPLHPIQQPLQVARSLVRYNQNRKFH